MKHLATTFLLAIAATLCCRAESATPVRWNNETADTTRVTRLLDMAATLPRAERTTAIARTFIDTPYGPATLERSPERLTVNLDTLDCTTFVDNVVALTLTANEDRRSWSDFIYNLRNLRYRGGEIDGWASRIHYNCEWVVENAARGVLEDITMTLPGAENKIKTINYISEHADLYPAMADPAVAERIRSLEMGYRSHRLPMLASSKISKAAMAMLREGDIIALTSRTDGLDVAHLGFVTLVDGVPHLLHASSKGRVMVDPLPLNDYVRRNRRFTGIRVLRLK